MNSKPWILSEINFLKNQYGKIPTKELSTELNRPEGGIYQKAFEFHLTKHYNRFTPEEDKFLKESDLKISSHQLSLLINHPASAIRQRRQFLGIESPRIKNPWTNFQRKLLIKLYSQANSNRELERILGHTRRTIASEAHRLKLKREKPHYFYSANHQFFQTWSSDMAYVLGFVFGDGNISNRKEQAYVRFSSKDREILEKIQKTMKSNHRIRKEITRGKFIIYRLVIASKIIQKDLENLGKSQKSSYSRFRGAGMQFPNIPSKFLNSFIRGYFDADGCLSLNRKETSYRISFCSICQNFLNNISKSISNGIKIEIKESVKHINRNIYSLQYGKEDSKKIYNWLYKDATIYLERKFYPHLI